jgi:hypothetical protein
MPETDKSDVGKNGVWENGKWNNRTSQTWPEMRHGCEGRSRTSFFVFFTKLTKSNDGAIPDNRSWNPRVFIGLTVFRFLWKLVDCSKIFWDWLKVLIWQELVESDLCKFIS